MYACTLSDVGLKRSSNQDKVYARTEPIGSLDNLFILADGMGGHKAGETASGMAVDGLIEFFGSEFPKKDIHGILKEGVKEVNKKMYLASLDDESLSGMGSTLVVATIKDRVLYVANIGDSRLYLLRGEMEQITKDNSYVEEMVAAGMIRRDSRDYREKKNYITRALGVEETVSPDLYALKLKPGDIVIICSDGLSNMVDEFEMEYIINSEKTPELQAKTLIDAANRNGGKDNISVILIDPQISEVDKP